MNTSRVFLTLVLVTAPLTTAQPQMDSTLTGQRVRIRVSDIHRQAELMPRWLELRGHVASVHGDSLALLIPASPEPLHIPRANMLGLAVSRGVPSRFESALRRGLWWGLQGALAGVMYLNAPFRNQGHTWEDAIGTGASLGLLTGVVIGASYPYERWRGVRIR